MSHLYLLKYGSNFFACHFVPSGYCHVPSRYLLFVSTYFLSENDIFLFVRNLHARCRDSEKCPINTKMWTLLALSLRERPKNNRSGASKNTFLKKMGTSRKMGFFPKKMSPKKKNINLSGEVSHFQTTKKTKKHYVATYQLHSSREVEVYNWIDPSRCSVGT